MQVFENKLTVKQKTVQLRHAQQLGEVPLYGSSHEVHISNFHN